MEPHAAHPKPQPAQDALARRHPRQPVGGDPRAVGEAARQAGEGRLVPHRQPQPARRGADVRLAEARFVEGRAHPLLACRPAAGPVIAAVVGVEPVEDVRGPEAGRLGHRDRVHLVLAEIAAVDGVRRVARVVQLAGLHQQVADPDPAGQTFRAVPLLGGQAGRDGGQRRGAVAQDAGRLGQQIARVDAAGEADDRPVELSQQGAQPGDPLVETRRGRRGLNRRHGSQYSPAGARRIANAAYPASRPR